MTNEHESRSTENSQLLMRSLSLSTYLCFFSLIFPLLSGAGWMFDIPLLKQGHPALPAMQPNTILGLLLSTAAVILSRKDWCFSRRSLIATSVAVIVSLLGLLTLCEYAFGWKLGIDHIFIHDTATSLQPFPGRPSPQTSLNFLFLGLAVIAFNLRLIPVSVAQIGAIFVGVNALVAATGYIFSTSQFYGFPVYAPAIGMAVNTSISFILLGAALLFSHPNEGMMTLVTSNTQGGLIARKVMFTAVAIPPLVGFLTRIGVIAGWYGIEIQVSLFTIVITGLILRTTWNATKQAEQEELRARVAFDEAKVANDQLQRALDERTQAQVQIRESQERFELALRGADLATWDWNIQTGEVKFNHRWAEMRGLQLDEVRPHVDSWTSSIHPDDLPRVQKALSDYFEGITQVYSIEFRVSTKSGGWIWILDRGRVFGNDRQGNPLRMVGTELNITERKRLEEDLRLAEAKSSGIISISPDAIISVDESQRIILFNEGAQKIFGYSKEEVLGESLDILIPERFRATHAQLVNRFANGEHVAKRVSERAKSVSGLRKSGEEFPADAAISKLEVGGKRILTVSLRDITEQKRIESELKTLAEKERIATRAREDVLAIVSHDLKNPLSSIGLVAQLLQRLNPDNFHQVQDYALRVQRSVSQMQRLIGDLLDFGKIQGGTLSVEKFREDPVEVILPVVEVVRIQAETKRQHLEVDLDPRLPFIDCDADRISQVLSNLLGNAIKFTPEGGTVRLMATLDKDMILISVSDTGPGIPNEQLPKVFDRFWQAQETKQLGSGLGLAIAKGIIEAHGTKIWAESQIGQGSCFSFTLPLATSSTKVRVEATLESGSFDDDRRRSLKGIHVMLVDDSPDMLFLMKHILQKAGVRVTEARSGLEALSKLAKERPSLIITDIEMPGCDGYALIEKIHQMVKDEHRHIPVVALTAHTDEKVLKKISEAGFDVRLSKPVQADILISSILPLVDRNLLH